MQPNQATIQSRFLRRELRSLRLELAAYSDESLIWLLPPALPNSGGTITLHLTGNLRHYIGTMLGGGSFVRNREAEFSLRDVPRAELYQQLAETEGVVCSVLPRLSDTQLTLPFPEPIRERQLTTGELLIQLAVHLSYHLGQISYHRRLVTGNRTGVGALAAADLFSDSSDQ